MTFIETSNLPSPLILKNGTTNPWTDERIELLTKLWKDGQSAGRIALQLGHYFTRSAILGKVHRLKLSDDPTIKKHIHYGIPYTVGRRPDGYRRKALPKTLVVRITRPIIAPTQPEPIARTSAACAFAELAVGDGRCRFPFGEPRTPDFAFCGLPAHGTYCPGHAQLCYTPAAPRQDKRWQRA